MTQRFHIDKHRRVAISELLSIAALCNGRELEIVCARIKTLLDGSKPWLLENDSLLLAYATELARIENVVIA